MIEEGQGGKRQPGVYENGTARLVILDSGEKVRLPSESLVADLVPEAVEIVVLPLAIGSQGELRSIGEDPVSTA